MLVVTSYHFAALPEPVPVTAQSATPRSSALYTSGNPIDTGCAPMAVTKSLSEAPKVRIFRPLRSARLETGWRHQINSVEERHVAGNGRERGCADVDLPGAYETQDFGTVQVHLRPSRKLDVDLSV